ncbi:MAG: ATP-binding protein [Campylobacterota bacterium]|nr:ATP-binding protein [Campylobacterota bacterium]
MIEFRGAFNHADGSLEKISNRCFTYGESAMRRDDVDVLNYINILETIMQIQEEILECSDFDDALLRSFKRIAEVMDVDRVYIFENSLQEEILFASQILEYNSGHAEAQVDNPELQNVPYATLLPRWLESFENDDVIEGMACNFPEAERRLLESKHTLSLICVPIRIGDHFWGFMGFDDCRHERKWAELEQKALKTFASSMAGAIFRVRQARELAHQKEAFEILYQKSSDAVLIIENGIFIDANESAVKMLGGSSTEAVTSVLNRHPGYLSPEFQPDGKSSYEKAEMMIALCKEKGVHRFEWVHRRLDGTDFWAEVVLTNINILEKELIHVVWRDISLRKENEALLITQQNILSMLNDQLKLKSEEEKKLHKELERSQKYQKAIFDGEPNIIITNLNGKSIYDANQAFFDFFGYPDVASFKEEHLCVCEYFVEKEGYLQSVMEGVNWIEYIHRYPARVHRVIMKKYGDEYVFSVRLNKITQGDDLIYIVSFNEISELIHYKNTLEKRIKEEVENSREKDRMLHNQSKSVQMGEMLNMIAHQWRQPLNAISASAISVAMKQELKLLVKEDIAAHAKFVQQHTQKMSKTINDFMNFFKPEQEMKDFKFEMIMEDIRSLMEAQLESRGIALLFNHGSDIVMHGYIKELAHVLINLISNSRDAFEKSSVEKAAITISLVKEGQGYQITVADNAGGIPDSVMEKMFNPYFTTKEQGKGTGIGLHMSQRIVQEVLLGTIEAENDNGGAIFTIRLPLVTAQRQVL